MLNKFNIDFIIIDKKEDIHKEGSSDAICPRSMEIFEYIDIELLKNIKKECNISNIINTYNNGIISSTKESFQTDSIYTYWIQISQFKLEKILEEYLLNKGVKIIRNAELINYDISNYNEKIYTYINFNTEIINIKTNYLIGCDGGKSFIRNKSGIYLNKEKGDEVSIIINDIELLENNIPTLNNSWNVFQSSIGNLFTLCSGNNYYRFSITIKDEFKEEYIINEIIKPYNIKIKNYIKKEYVTEFI